jgi:hypothetical protein
MPDGLRWALACWIVATLGFCNVFEMSFDIGVGMTILGVVFLLVGGSNRKV